MPDGKGFFISIAVLFLVVLTLYYIIWTTAFRTVRRRTLEALRQVLEA